VDEIYNRADVMSIEDGFDTVSNSKTHCCDTMASVYSREPKAHACTEASVDPSFDDQLGPSAKRLGTYFAQEDS